MKYNEIYENSLSEIENGYIESSNFSTKPIMVSGIISPQSTICIQPMFGIEFGLDKLGVNKVLDRLENKLATRTEEERKNLLIILTDVYMVTEEYLGGHGNAETRKNAYFQSDDRRLELSEIEGKNIGLCAERAAIGHQMLSILEKTGQINFESFFTNSHLTTQNREPHSFIVLKHKNDSSRQYIFDIENPLEYKKSEDSKSQLGLALYPMSEKEYEDFREGKSIALKSIYEQAGMLLVGEKRIYGDEEFEKEIEI